MRSEPQRRGDPANTGPPTQSTTGGQTPGMPCKLNKGTRTSTIRSVPKQYMQKCGRRSKKKAVRVGFNAGGKPTRPTTGGQTTRMPYKQIVMTLDPPQTKATPTIPTRAAERRTFPYKRAACNARLHRRGRVEHTSERIKEPLPSSLLAQNDTPLRTLSGRTDYTLSHSQNNE